MLWQSASYADLKFHYDEKILAFLKKNFTRPKSLYLLAKQNEKFVGICAIDDEWWEPNSFFLREIFIRKEYQKTGIGTRFFAACIEFARSQKVDFVLTETAFKNLPMQKLCRKFGFVEWDNPQWKEGITFRLRI